MIYNIYDALEGLRSAATIYGRTSGLALQVINSQEFQTWTGASRPTQHHYGKGGLIVHTYEVVRLCMSVNAEMGYPVNPEKLFIAALFHDVGKMFDYEPTDETMEEWRGNEHKKLIHHISRSALVFNERARSILKQDEIDEILHAILSHHGMRAWGSPVEPHTKMAWILHLCDNMSARLDDCNYTR